MSVKYKNPGNIRPGQGYAGETGEFYYDKNGEPYVIFDSIELGLRAMFVDLRSKIKEFDGDIKSIVNKYAPPEDDNPTSNYSDFVISNLGKDKVTEDDLLDVVKSFVKFENKPDLAKTYLKEDLLDTALKLSSVSMPRSHRLKDALAELKTEVINTKNDDGFDVLEGSSENTPNVLNAQEALTDSADIFQSINNPVPDIINTKTDDQPLPDIINTKTDASPTVQQEALETSSVLDVQEELVDSASAEPVTPLPRKPRKYSDDNFREDFLEVNTSKVQGYVPREDLYNEDYFGFTDDSTQIWSAAMRANNPIYSVSNFIVDQFIDKKQDDPSYDPASDKRIKKDELWNYIDSGSYDETTRIMKRIQEQRQDMAILSMSQSGVAEFTSSMLTPTTIAPLAPLRFMKSTSALNRFMGAGAFNAAVMAPEELIMAEQNVNRDLSHAALTIAAAGLIGGGLNAAIGGRYVSRTVVGDDLDEFGEPVYRSAGASVSPEKAREAQWAMMEGDAFVETGVGIEKLGWNPVNRLIKSLSPVARSLAPEMVDMGGMMQKKVKDGVEMAQSVESTFRTKYLSGLLGAMRSGQEAYLSYRGVNAKGGDVRKSFQTIGVRVKDAATRQTDFLSEYQFRERVSRAMRRNDIDDIGDTASPFVTQAAQAYRKQLDLLAKNGTEVGLFKRQLNSQLIAAREIGDAVLIARLEKALKDLQEKGLLVNTAETYVPKVARIDKIMANEALFLRKVSEWAIANKGMNPNAAQKFARESMDSYTNARPYLSPEDPDMFDFIVKPSGIKARTSEIPDEVIEEFLENDIEVLIRHQTKTMGMDIELERAFGGIDMRDVINQVTNDYEQLISKAKTAKERKDLSNRMEADIRDIRGLRDRLRGTYGASKDPHAMSSRFVRNLKSFNVIVGMGGAMVSSIPDIARTVMVEGITNTYEYGIKNLFKSNQSIVKKMMDDEMKMAAISADVLLGLRSSAFSDIGDMFGARFGFERGMNSTASMMFMLNGLNIWNQVLKEFAGNVTALRMTKAIMTDWSKLSKSDKEKLLKNGISAQDHAQMRQLIEKNGTKEQGIWMPNTSSWGNDIQVRKFRNALNQNVDRIIVTPGAGDRALWTSTELGSLMTQFKSYGQGATVRLLASGLQERDGAFWQGAFMLIGLASIVNEFKRAQYGIDSKETFDEKLLNAIDRSGIGGYFTDVNNAVEKLTNNKIGMRPAFTDSPQYKLPDAAKAGAVLGPGISNLMTASDVFADVVTGSADEKTLRNSRFITPFSTLPPLDPILDGVFGE
jgi:hypothetical protein